MISTPIKSADGITANTNYDAASDVAGLKILFVNIFLIGTADRWVLIDAGLPGTAGKIKAFAENRFGKGTKPEAIVLTHGHFDHVGALESLLEIWDVPVYAHTLEMPYLTGLSNYPPPDPTIGGGGMSYLSWTFPIKPLRLKHRMIELREGTFIPDLPDWHVIHTPGHSPGHVSLFRETDRVLIAGDALVTVNQNSLSAVMSQSQQLNGPPAYFTCDWKAAEQSVEKLAALSPEVAACGHGIPMKGETLRKELIDLVMNFKALSIPSQGRYVKKAARTNAQGIVDMPFPVSYHAPRIVVALIFSAIVGIGVYRLKKKYST